MADHSMAIEALHRFVDYVSTKDPVSAGFIGPRPITSRHLYPETHIEAGGGLLSQTAHLIMVRCVFPPNTQSRHAVIHMKLSMIEEQLASKLYEMFDLEATKGIITESVSVWSPGLLSAPRRMEFARHFNKGVALLGTTKGGILELKVISERQFAVCPRCNHQGIVDAAMLQRLRERCIDVRRLCIGCLQQLGCPADTEEVVMPGGARIQAI